MRLRLGADDTDRERTSVQPDDQRASVPAAGGMVERDQELRATRRLAVRPGERGGDRPAQPAAIRPTPANARATPTHCDRVSRSRNTVHASKTVATGYSDPTTEISASNPV